MLLACHMELGNWDAVIELASAIGKAKAGDPTDLEQVLQRAWCGRLEASFLSADARQHVRETWSAIPRRLKRAPVVAAHYAECLDAAGDSDEAYEYSSGPSNRIPMIG